ncbi:unnamed protein product [Rhizoctonia solani]|uniref:Heterokaryon incompatibility protein n=1 Tax=Rhizoctonia solani AG-3 Rhs1AP TaxID=1086054 RepID=X8JDJ7_9AGAM|nr:heterokaryon incompatibility protein [Rhizoctonia solani AG-3 Rhs1AP]CAE6377800.1 unnamed protein product [Rhizoctonia solani]
MENCIQTGQCTEQQAPIYEYNLSEPFDRSKRFTMDKTTPDRYRFVACAPLLSDNPTIEVYEYTELPSSYTCVSYVWYGEESGDTGTFEVAAKDKDKGEGHYKASGHPISIQILKDACCAAQKKGTNLIWLDRLCINKSDDVDNSWQTMEMHKIYQGSKLCVVFPGGLWRLTDLYEETKWIDRGWTLQEAVAPPEVQVMFKWTHGESMAKARLFADKQPSPITEITSGACAMAPLLLLLDCTISKTLQLIDKDTGECCENIDVAMFGAGPQPDKTVDYRFVLPSVAALAVILNMPRDTHNHDQEYYHCIWKSTMMRTTSDPRDMIFSVMGLFGVTLNPGGYDKSDCVKPAIALAQKILDKEGRATWLGVSFFSPPCPHLSTFPSFPKPLGSDKISAVAIPETGYVQAPQLMLNECIDPRALMNMPQGKIDKDGYLTFTANSVPVDRVPLNPGTRNNNTTSSLPGSIYSFEAINGVSWCKRTSSLQEGRKPDAFAVLLGCFKVYSPFSASDRAEFPFKIPDYDASSLRGFIIVRQGDTDKFSLESYFMLTIEAKDWVAQWERQEFCVGGPQAIGEEVKYEKELPDTQIQNYTLQRFAQLKAINLYNRDLRRAGREDNNVILAMHAPGTSFFSIKTDIMTMLHKLTNVLPEVAYAAVHHDSMSPSARRESYEPLGGESWQEEGHWTAEAMMDLRNRLNGNE